MTKIERLMARCNEPKTGAFCENYIAIHEADLRVMLSLMHWMRDALKHAQWDACQPAQDFDRWNADEEQPK